MTLNLQEVTARALSLHQSGREAEAEPLYRQILALSPHDLTASCMLGAMRFHQQRPDEAMALFDAAIAAHPGLAGPLMFYGQLLPVAGRFDRALECFDQVLALEPDNLEALINRGSALRKLKRHDEAVASYAEALRINPASADALNNRGNALKDLKRPQEALASFDAALARDPSNGLFRFNRALVLLEMARFDEALGELDLLSRKNPADAGIHYHRGLALEGLRQFADALESYDRVLVLEPNRLDARNNRGRVLQQLGRYEEALESYNQLLSIAPDFPDALLSRGTLLWLKFDRLADALPDLEKATRLDPDRPYLKGDLVHLKIEMCDWRDLEEQIAGLAEGVQQGRKIVHPSIYLALSQSPADLRRAAEIYADDKFAAQPPLGPRGARRPGKIRLGYAGSEFREHAMGFLMAGLYEHHDKDSFEITAFDAGWNDNSPLRRRMEAAFDHWVDLSQWTDRERAQTIRERDIDILINISGYSQLEPIGMFAHRPAPVQVHYLGCPATLGTTYMDYLLADRIVIPPDEQSCYAENIVYLPDSYWVNDSRRPIADTIPSRAACGLPERGFVFCNFNHIYKLTPQTFTLWMDILRQTKDSVLWLLESNAEFPARLKAEAQAQGVAASRLVFAKPAPPADHLARLALAGLCLDSLPYNAHTTAADCLWAGVPVVTWRGTSFPGRVAGSLLEAMGLPELIAENLSDYRNMAVRLASDPAALTGLVQKLHRNRLTTPLFDTARFCRHIQAAYTRMWEMSQAGESPRGFTVPPLS